MYIFSSLLQDNICYVFLLVFFFYRSCFNQQRVKHSLRLTKWKCQTVSFCENSNENILTHITLVFFYTAELEPSRDLQCSLISCLKAFPLLCEVFLRKSHTVQSSSLLHKKFVADQDWHKFSFSLQMEAWIHLLRMYVAFKSFDITMLEKPTQAKSTISRLALQC